jgi:hypothetical protein
MGENQKDHVPIFLEFGLGGGAIDQSPSIYENWVYFLTALAIAWIDFIGIFYSL